MKDASSTSEYDRIAIVVAQALLNPGMYSYIYDVSSNMLIMIVVRLPFKTEDLSGKKQIYFENSKQHFDTPTVLVDASQQILLWYLPSILTVATVVRNLSKINS